MLEADGVLLMNARDATIFGIDNSSSFHTDLIIVRIIFLCQLKDLLMILMIVLVQQEKIYITTKTNISVPKTNHWDESHLVVNKTEIYKLKGGDNIP